ncbi:MAG: S-layer homology domain-containing protein [Ignavibacteriales bacterium]
MSKSIYKKLRGMVLTVAIVACLLPLMMKQVNAATIHTVTLPYEATEGTRCQAIAGARCHITAEDIFGSEVASGGDYINIGFTRPISDTLVNGDIAYSEAGPFIGTPEASTNYGEWNGLYLINYKDYYFYAPTSGTYTFTVLLGNEETSAEDNYNVTITVNSSNNAPTNMALSSASIAAANTGINSAVGTLSTTDSDEGDSFTYTLVAGDGDTDNGSFNISGSSLRTNGALAIGTYSVRVRTTDSGPATFDKAFTISVTNSIPTNITLSANSINAISTGANVEVGTLSTTDADAGDSFLYSKVAGAGAADNGSFNISGNSLRTNGVLATGSYSVRIKTTDNLGDFYEKSFTITVSNVAGKALTADESDNNVDNPIVIGFGVNAGFAGAITGVSFNGHALTSNQYTVDTVNNNKVTLNPSNNDNAYLQTPATGNVVITATGYNNSTIAQTITAGVVDTLVVSQQPAAGTASGDEFATQPIVTLKDQYGNTCTNGPSATANVVATAAGGTGTWTIDGTTTKAAIAGVATFDDLTCTLTTVGTGKITFTSTETVDSNPFTIPLKAAVALTADTTANNVDNNIEVTFIADADFEAAITSVSFNGSALTATTDYVVASGKVTLKPSGGNAVLQTPATGNVVIAATGYNNSTVSQTITIGAVAKMEVTQNITAPATNGGQFAQQPKVALEDQYGNICANDSTTVITVSKKDLGIWTLTGTLTTTASSGVATFSGLGVTNTAAVTGAQLAFDTTGLTQVTSAVVNLPAPASNHSNSPIITTPPTTETNTVVIVNGQEQNAGTTNTTTIEDKTVTTITVDDKKIDEKLSTEGNNATVVIPVNNNSDVVVGVLNGQTVKNMEAKEAVLEIKTENVTYTLPASEINIDDVSSQIGKQVELKDIKVSVTIAEPPTDTARIVEDTANKNSYQVVVKPVEFQITCTSGNKTVDVSKFNGYVERTVAIPDGVDPSKITTGIVLNKDGTFSHVPTAIIVVNGKYYAKINSLTNSAYSVIWSPKSFKDVENHWAKEAVNDMGSRLVIDGVGEDKFKPDSDITRAEFAAIVVRALGLMRKGTGKDSFKDVRNTDWYFDAVSIAYEYKLVNGYEDGNFEPMDKITREQAMTMIARAIKITGLKIEFKDGEVEKLFTEYEDSEQSSAWAKDSIAACVKAGIVSGKSGRTLAPKDEITRAEVAAIVERLLRKSGLI